MSIITLALSLVLSSSSHATNCGDFMKKDCNKISGCTWNPTGGAKKLGSCDREKTDEEYLKERKAKQLNQTGIQVQKKIANPHKHKPTKN